MPRIDLNADLGEEITDDRGLLRVVTSANVACGFHAGSAAIMRTVCDLAVERGVAIGAQVSYRDRANFGRRAMNVDSATLTDWVAEQVQALGDIATAAGTQVRYLKPHGALYNRVVEDTDQAAAVLTGSAGLPILTLPVGEFRRLALEEGRSVKSEGFPDRGYTDAGRLIPRDHDGALIHGARAIAAQAVSLASRVDSVCVHGDSPDAVEVATTVRHELEAAGFQLETSWV